MSTKAQIEANQKNAQRSTGPTSEPGRQRSSRNATRHGFTGLTLIVTADETEAYQAHVQSYRDHHKPADHRHTELVQQLADLRWSLQQIFIQQTNTMSLMTAIDLQVSEAGDPVATAAAVAAVARTLNTLGLYESRRRRAAQSAQKELEEYEQAAAEQRKSQETKPQPTPKPQIGSVCSSPVPAPVEHEIFDNYTTVLDETEALIAQWEAENDPEKAAQLRRLIGM